jgi:hypothetical protein
VVHTVAAVARGNVGDAGWNLIAIVVESIDGTGTEARAIKARPAGVGAPPPKWQGDLIGKRQRAAIGMPESVIRMD